MNKTIKDKIFWVIALKPDAGQNNRRIMHCKMKKTQNFLYCLAGFRYKAFREMRPTL